MQVPNVLICWCEEVLVFNTLMLSDFSILGKKNKKKFSFLVCFTPTTSNPYFLQIDCKGCSDPIGPLLSDPMTCTFYTNHSTYGICGFVLLPTRISTEFDSSPLSSLWSPISRRRSNTVWIGPDRQFFTVRLILYLNDPISDADRSLTIFSYLPSPWKTVEFQSFVLVNRSRSLSFFYPGQSWL